MFTRLRTKLTVLYAALLGAALILVSVVVYNAIVGNAERLVRNELQASATVFDRIWALRSRQLQDSAAVLSRDFGFREALASGDEATVRSALINLSNRLGLDFAAIVGVDGTLTTADGRDLGAVGADLVNATDGETGPTGVLMIGDTPYEAISAPILSPVLTGWVVFGARLDDAEMASLEKLSAIPLQAMVMHRGPAGWTATNERLPAGETKVAGAFIDKVVAGHAVPEEVTTVDGRALAVVKPLRSVSAARPFVLMLRYPLAGALAPYRPLINAIAATGLLGAIVLLVGSWALARGVTRPISALDEAARRLAKGEDASVAVTSRDEIGGLARSFNQMAAEIRERERRLAAALDRAESANRLTGEFLANMSHEIRTPLNGVLGLAQVLSQTTKDPTQRQLTDTILESAGALERLLCDILEAAQLRSGAAELQVEPFSLSAALDAAAAPWRLAATDKGIGFAFEIAAGADTVVMGDSARLEQVLNALLSNAVKFTAAGEVGLSAAPCERGFRFEVTDTGPGVDPAAKDRIFGAFQQADGSSTRRHGGVGLGLSVAQGFTELMGGRIDCEPRAGGGSRFWFELPLAPAAPPARAVA